MILIYVAFLALANSAIISAGIFEEVIEEEVGVAEDGSVPIVEADLPLAGDYHGIGGPSTVPLESEGAFEKPEIPHYNFLTDLFMSPSDDAIKSFQITERKRLM